MSTVYVNCQQAQQYLCAICQHVMINPCQIGCNGRHVFCKQCVVQLTAHNQFISKPSKCPICTTLFTTNSLIEIPFIQRQINELKVKCSNHIPIIINHTTSTNKTNKQTAKNILICGKKRKYPNENDIDLYIHDKYNSKKQKLSEKEHCDWIGAYGDIKNHLNICPYQRINCKYLSKGCGHQIRRKDMALHLNNCQYVTLRCSQCSVKVLRGGLRVHLSQICEMRMVKCNINGCNERMRQIDIVNHKKYVCGEAMIECEYMKYGCYFIRRKAKEQHNKQCMEHHLKLIVKSHDKLERELVQMKVLEEKNKKMNEENISLRYKCPKCKGDLIGKSACLVKIGGEVKCSKCGDKQDKHTVWYCPQVNCGHWIVCRECRYY